MALCSRTAWTTLRVAHMTTAGHDYDDRSLFLSYIDPKAEERRGAVAGD